MRASAESSASPDAAVLTEKGSVSAGETQQAIEATFRIERARLIAGLARVVRNFDLAEELSQDALVIALSEWPRTGVPANPGAWLMTVARRRAIDAIRRDKMRRLKHDEIARALDGGCDSAADAICGIRRSSAAHSRVRTAGHSILRSAAISEMRSATDSKVSSATPLG